MDDKLMEASKEVADCIEAMMLAVQAGPPPEPIMYNPLKVATARMTVALSNYAESIISVMSARNPWLWS